MIWRIEKFKKVDVPEKEHGIFYDGDCYVILYTYQVKKYEKYIQVKTSSSINDFDSM